MTIDPHTTPEAVSTQIIERAAGALRNGATYPRVNVSWDGLQYSNPDPITLTFAPSVVDVVVVDEGPRYRCCEHCADDHTQIDPLNNHTERCEVIFCRKGRRRVGKPFIECDPDASRAVGKLCWAIWPADGSSDQHWFGPLDYVIDHYLADAANGL